MKPIGFEAEIRSQVIFPPTIAYLACVMAISEEVLSSFGLETAHLFSLDSGDLWLGCVFVVPDVRLEMQQETVSLWAASSAP